MTSFLCKLGQKKTIVKRFYQHFFQNYWIATQVINIVSPNIFDWKSARKSKAGVVFGAKIGPN